MEDDPHDTVRNDRCTRCQLNINDLFDIPVCCFHSGYVHTGAVCRTLIVERTDYIHTMCTTACDGG